MSRPCYMVFPSTYWALKAERLLKEQGFVVRLRPVPRSISSSCGICLEFNEDTAHDLCRTAREIGIESSGAFTREGVHLEFKEQRNKG